MTSLMINVHSLDLGAFIVNRKLSILLYADDVVLLTDTELLKCEQFLIKFQNGLRNGTSNLTIQGPK